MKIKRCLLASAASLLPFAANAADLPVKAPLPAPPPPAFTWTGLYLGASAGFITQGTTFTDVGTATSPSFGLFAEIPGETLGINGAGGIFGFDIGYNYQIGPWVLGVEADISGTTLNNSTSALAFGEFPSSISSKLPGLATLRGRVGYAFDRLLIYATGGFAAGTVSNTVSVSGLPAAFSAATGDWQTTGWTVGGGIEYAFTYNWILRLEGLYVDLGSVTATNNPEPSHPQSNCRFGFKNTYALGRGGVEYKF